MYTYSNQRAWEEFITQTDIIVESRANPNSDPDAAKYGTAREEVCSLWEQYGDYLENRSGHPLHHHI